MDHLQQLCKDLHIDPQLQSENGFFRLSITPSLIVHIQPRDPGTLLIANIAQLPEMKKEEILILLMKANLFGQGTLGATIGLDPKQNILTLSANFPYDRNYRLFREQLEDFVNIVDYWREEIRLHIEKAKSGII